MRDHIQRTPHPPAKDYITLSFYQFRPISENDLVKIQYYFLTDLRVMDVVGRIYVSAEGINAQISCPKDQVEQFKEYYATHWPIFDKIRFNPAMSEGKAFKKLHVRVKKQLVSDGIDNNTFDLYNEPMYLTPEEWHKELSSLEKAPILIDMRNHYESAIGHFEHSIRPDVTTFRENVDAMLEICKGKEDQDIYMYCTGGIRCTRSGALLKSNGFKSVKMLQGGVTAYGRYIQEQLNATATADDTAATDGEQVKSIYKGKNFTFDKRLGEPITDDVLAKCHTCGTPCDSYCNCSNMTCNLLMISCPSCQEKHEGTCGSSSCVDMVTELKEKQKQIPKDHPGLVGMKARLGIKPFHEHHLRVRPSTVIEMRKNKEHSRL
ncbi:Rhodanese-like domain-containing protein [Gamsiella multidivaricata]|uniref:Rhodanese-like domain-containing protein n=1 Tax=Gamsiella multidivaricata TaxID=101098 RepID=UPI00221FD16E|nr:Rhodanese-like domain-containing protein [Gamsiella multidivaricata]KAI7816132.1 Rhodanese-like domain-containing protein [Gamsiella multidivaricata]